MKITSLQYPIGRYSRPLALSELDRQSFIQTLAAFPALLSKQIEGISSKQLQATYRPDGWTVQQILHHLSDSHMNSFMRFKLALTEDNPLIKLYNEAMWAELADSKSMPIEIALDLLTGIHAKWVFLMQGFSKDDWSRTFTNPESASVWRLDQAAGLYA